MSYRPLKIASTTPKHVKSLIRSLENHYFIDVHTMLRLPLPAHDLTAGCNFAIAQVLAASVSGISVTLYSQKGGSGARFTDLLKGHYPWSLEPGIAVTPEGGAKVLYTLIRNPLTHDLGLDLQNRRKGQKVILKRLATNQSTRGLSERFIEGLESKNRPSPMSPTVTIFGGRTVVLIEALYWGVRQMVEHLTHDTAGMQRAEAFLASI